jgi:hypothetical protein
VTDSAWITASRVTHSAEFSSAKEIDSAGRGAIFSSLLLPVAKVTNSAGIARSFNGSGLR